MKKYHLILIFLLTSISILNACRKNEQTSESAQINLLKAKKWFLEQNIKLYNPNWDAITNITIGRECFLVLPTNIKYNSKDKIGSQLLLNMSSSKIESYIVEFINSDLPLKEEELVEIYKNLIRRSENEIAKNFNGSILLFTAKHEFIDGWYTANGKLLGKIGQKEDKSKKMAKMSIDHEKAQCTDWYYVIYDVNTGQIYSSTYLYSVCDNTNDGGGGGGGNDAAYITRDIHNKTTDICISKTLDAALKGNNDVMGIMADIIKKFDTDRTIDINIFDGNIYYSNGSPKPGQTTYQGFDANHRYTSNITLGIEYHHGSSKESLITSMIHEVIHSYLGYTSNNFLKTEEDHNVISEKYITPMATYLQSAFGMPLKDAYSLAWSGVPDSKVYNNNTPGNTQYKMSDGNIITKTEIDFLALPYKDDGNDPKYKKGTPICQ